MSLPLRSFQFQGWVVTVVLCSCTKVSYHHGIGSYPKEDGVLRLHHSGFSSSSHGDPAATCPPGPQCLRRGEEGQPRWRRTCPHTHETRPVVLGRPQLCKQQELDSRDPSDRHSELQTWSNWIHQSKAAGRSETEELFGYLWFSLFWKCALDIKTTAVFTVQLGFIKPPLIGGHSSIIYIQTLSCHFQFFYCFPYRQTGSGYFFQTITRFLLVIQI